MKTAYDYLIAEVNPEEIMKVTLNELELDVEKTLELMKETYIDMLFDDLVFWTKNARFDRVIEYDYYGDETIYFQERKIKQKTKKKVIPDSLVEMWIDPVTQERLPFKTKAYLKEEEKYRIQAEKEEQFWQEIINDKDHLFINHRAYYVSKEKNPTFKGFGGAKYKIIKLDTGEIIETDNLWTNGELPKKYWNEVKDNAEFL